MSDEQAAALEELKRAMDFFDKVKSAPIDEQIAAGNDAWEWLEKAARAVRATL